MLYVATRKGLFTLDGGKIKHVSFLGVPVTTVLPAKDAVYAAVGHGHFGVKLHKSTDRGASWSEIPGPQYPAKPEGVEELEPFRKIPIPWNLELLWTLEQAPDGAIWAGTIPGGVFRNGELVRSLWDRPERKQWTGGGYDYPGAHSIVFAGSQVLVGISTGGVWRSEDGGANWQISSKGMWAAYLPPELKDNENMQDVHRLARCKAKPESVWAQHHNGAFHSGDGGRTWTEIHPQPSSFGFAVAAHPKDPRTAWFVPAVKDETRVPVDGKLVVSRTRDGGKTFEALGKGLPQEHAYDLIYRHALDVDDTGTRLAIASTTGSLWTSDDGGDSWRTVSANLPPAYALRFG